MSRILGRVPGTDSASNDAGTSGEMPLLRRCAAQEIGPAESEIQRRVIMQRRLGSQRGSVVKVRDEEGVVEVDRHRNVRHLMKPPVGGVPRNDGGVRPLRGARELAAS